MEGHLLTQRPCVLKLEAELKRTNVQPWQSFEQRFELKRTVAELYTASCKGLGVHPFQGFWAQLGLKDCLQILKQHEFCSAGRNLSQMVDS